MSAVSGQTAPPSSADELASLLEGDDLAEVVAAHAALVGIGVAVLTPSGSRLAADGPGVDAPALGHHHNHPIYYRDQRIGDLVLGPCLRTDRGEAGSTPGSRREALEAAIPSVDQPELERMARHLERVILAQLRRSESMSGRPKPPTKPPSDQRDAKASILATVSHELRTPLTSIIGYTEMLLEGMAGPVAAEQREYLNTILGKADHLLRLISGMLELARMDARSPDVERRPISIIEVINRAATTLTSEADRRAIAVSLPKGELPRVLADSTKIRQVLVHLIANAIKFTPRGGDVTIAATVGPLSPSDDEGPALADPGRFGIRVSVIDTGIGITPMAQARIFEPFFQVDQSTTREYGGTGLGLSLAKTYVEAHGGSIWVQSQPGEGSTFTLSLPVVPEELRAFVENGRSAAPAQ